MPAKKGPAAFPTKSELLEFMKEFKGNVSKRDIARAFHIKGPDKVQLKKMLREMEADGTIAKDRSRSLRPSDQLPGVTVIEFAGTDRHGDALARPSVWDKDETPPTIFITPPKRKNIPALGPGDKALARLTPIKDNAYRADIMKLLQKPKQAIMGVFKGGPEGGRIHPVDKKDRHDYLVERGQDGGAEHGELVMAEQVTRGRKNRGGPRMARVIRKIGDLRDARSISLIAVHAHDIPHEFPDHVTRAADTAEPVTLGKRDDLRDIPLITIDPADARDHDDAIWCEADPDPNNKGGWHTIVAIADVAHYVQPGNALDKEARKRGNSCYFPDRVIPMLPERLSAGLCSLQPGQDRACMAVHMWFSSSGKKLRHKFVRGLMKSHANITYEQAQSALDGTPDTATEPLVEPVLKPLYGAFQSIMEAREKRAPLDLDLPEKKILLDDQGHVQDIVERERLDAHRIVEEFMIQSNVAAAEELEKHRVPAMYRVHEEPPMDKMESLRDFLRTMDLTLAKGAVMKPVLFNGILRRVKNSPVEHLVNEVILRSQTQAYYSPENQGHFGLALARYAHFTSPIRRYADLIVHRGLIRALKLGDDGLHDDDMAALETIGQHISDTERRAMAAERDSKDRYLASYLSDHIGEIFSGRISGVTRFGLFINLEPSGGDGLIPISALGDDYYRLDEENRRLVGERNAKSFNLGQTLDVRLVEANPYSGGLRLALVDKDGNTVRPKGFSEGSSHKGRRRKRPDPPSRTERPKSKKRRR